MTVEKTVFIYASGSKILGYGHLYRCLYLFNLITSLSVDLKYRVKFIVDSNLKLDFFSARNMPCVTPDAALSEKNGLLIVDSKESSLPFEIEQVLIKSKCNIALDCQAEWVHRFDYIVFPNFYTEVQSVSYRTNFPADKILAGVGYTIIPSVTEMLPLSTKDLLISFGGSDPNFLTRVILEELSERLLKNTRVILGPGFLDDDRALKKSYPTVDFVYSPANLLPYLYASRVVVTAMGSTVNQIEYCGNSSIVLLLNAADEADAIDIGRRSNHKSKWRFLRLGSADFSRRFISNVESIISDASRPIYCRGDWGEAWGQFLEKLSL